MIVVDASVLVELLLRGREAETIQRVLRRFENRLHAPHLIDLEVAQVMRRHLLAGELETHRASESIEWMRDVRLQRHAHTPFLNRIWQLRSNLSAYDAAYVSLAESLDATLVTRDVRLAGAPGLLAAVEVV